MVLITSSKPNPLTVVQLLKPTIKSMEQEISKLQTQGWKLLKLVGPADKNFFGRINDIYAVLVSSGITEDISDQNRGSVIYDSGNILGKRFLVIQYAPVEFQDFRVAMHMGMDQDRSPGLRALKFVMEVARNHIRVSKLESSHPFANSAARAIDQHTDTGADYPNKLARASITNLINRDIVNRAQKLGHRIPFKPVVP
jgi:hypothetical protein